MFLLSLLVTVKALNLVFTCDHVHPQDTETPNRFTRFSRVHDIRKAWKSRRHTRSNALVNPIWILELIASSKRREGHNLGASGPTLQLRS